VALRHEVLAGEDGLAIEHADAPVEIGVHVFALDHGYTRLRLEIRADNAASLALFKRRGYRRFGRHAGYYHDGMDAVRLEKALQR
jgi:ribosomal protein S18 acetylase RimI-like enzyme